jgi:hypothetical protein
MTAAIPVLEKGGQQPIGLPPNAGFTCQAVCMLALVGNQSGKAGSDLNKVG